MGRDRVRITELDLDHAYGIRKLCNGNLKYFFDKYIRDEIPQQEFYNAMKHSQAITPKIERVIDDAYFEALADFGITNDELSIMPTFQNMFKELFDDLEMNLITMEQFIDKHKLRVKFYSKAIDAEIIKIIKSKKSTIVE